MRRILLPFVLVVLNVGVACAQDAPGRVGRLSYIEGTVSLHFGDQTDWAPATLNYPVTTGEAFWTEPSARAEIQVGPIELRLDQSSELEILRLDDATIELQLDQGALNLHLWQMPQGGISVMTPRGRVVLTMLGSYTIDAGQPNGDLPADRVQVTVLEGAARFEGERGAVDIRHSEAAIISGEPMNVTLAAATYSSFDDWALARERREVAAQQPGYVAPTVTGYQDLNEYGSWSHDPTYGGVWYPAAVPAGWAPYRYGHWAFVQPWGWTWIDDAPWGFAPFHYGRWIETGDRWGWVPGALVERPVYAPALVAFIGGDGWGINLRAGATMAAVGWVALAPNEVYRPYYRASQTYIRKVNVTNVNRTVINNITINNNENAHVSSFHNRQAATVVPAAAFTRAAPVQRATVVVPQAELARASVAPSITHLRPDAAARRGGAVPAAAASVPQPDAPATIARTRVATTPPAREAEPAPVAPGPHRMGSAPRNAAAPPQRQPSQSQPSSNNPVRDALSGRPTLNAQQPPPPETRGGAFERAPPSAAAPNSQQPLHPTTSTDTSRRRTEPFAAPTAPAPPVAAMPPTISAPAARAPQPVAVPSRPQPPAQPIRRPPPMEVAHPEQQTHIEPTPHAWTRMPGTPPQPPAAAPARGPAAAAGPPAAQLSKPDNAAPPSRKTPGAKDDRKDDRPERQ